MSHLRNLQILMVEDEATLRSIFTHVLTTTYPGCTIHATDSHDGAINIVNEGFLPHLIMTDLAHWGPKGDDLVSELRSRPETAFVPLIVASAQAYGSTRRLELYERGATAILAKPFSLSALVTTVGRVLHLRSDPDEALIHLGTESESLEYKGTIDLQDKSKRAALAKDIIAMANSGGGTIIAGVEEPSLGRFIPRGLSENELTVLEPAKLNASVRPYLDPPITVAARRLRSGPYEFVVIQVPSVDDTLVLPARQHEAAGLFPGRVYVRRGAESVELRDSHTLRTLIGRLCESKMAENAQSRHHDAG